MTPGTSKIDPATGLPPVLNNTLDDPNKIARDRERVLAATAVAATGGEGEFAKPPPLDDGPAMRTATMPGGERVQVRLSPVRRDAASVKYGPESKLAKGTPVKSDGTAIEGSEHPYGVIGDIQTEEGLLVNRVIPLEALEAQGT